MTKKNGRNIFYNQATQKPFIGKSKDLGNAEQYLLFHLLNARNQYKNWSPIKEDVHICFRFIFDDFYTKDERRRLTLPDLSNLYELPQDILQEAGIIVNDSQVASHDGSRRLPGVANFLEIWIWAHKDEYE